MSSNEMTILTTKSFQLASNVKGDANASKHCVRPPRPARYQRLLPYDQLSGSFGR